MGHNSIFHLLLGFINTFVFFVGVKLLYELVCPLKKTHSITFFFVCHVSRNIFILELLFLCILIRPLWFIIYDFASLRPQSIQRFIKGLLPVLRVLLWHSQSICLHCQLLRFCGQYVCFFGFLILLTKFIFFFEISSEQKEITRISAIFQQFLSK